MKMVKNGRFHPLVSFCDWDVWTPKSFLQSTMMGKAFGNIKTLILESCVISQVFVTLCNLYNFQALCCSYIFIQLKSGAVAVVVAGGRATAAAVVHSTENQLTA